MKILIGYDGSECADAALKDLQFAGLPDAASALVLSAADVFLPPKPAVEDLDDPFINYVPHGVKMAWKRARKQFAETESIATQGSEKLQSFFPGWTVESEAVADTPHWAIIDKAKDWKPNLVVVGSHGRSALGRAILGSVSQKVLNETTSSVRIARGRDKSLNDSVRLILAMDGSPDSMAMIDEVVRRNWQHGTEIKIVTAVEIFVEDEAEAEGKLNRTRDLQYVAAEKLTSAGLTVSRVITEEDPKHFLVREAEDWQSDCIFLGAQGHRFLDRLLVGSVSSSVAARAACSVEIVRRKV